MATIDEKAINVGGLNAFKENILDADYAPHSVVTALNIEMDRAMTAENNLQTLYNNLQQSKPVPVTALPATGEEGKIYRLAGTTSYADYMWDGSQFIKMAEYDNAIDDEPTAGSDNLTKSGGILTDIIKASGIKLPVYQGQIDGSNGRVIPNVIWGAYTDVQHSEQEAFVNVGSLGSLSYRIEGISYYTDETGSTFDHWESVRKDSAKISSNKYYRVFITQEPLSTTENIEVQNVLALSTDISKIDHRVSELESERQIKNNLIMTQGQINGITGEIIPNINWGLYSDKIYINGTLSVESLGTNELIIAGVAIYNKSDDSFVSYDSVQTRWIATYNLYSLDSDKYARAMLIARYTTTLIPITPSEAYFTLTCTVKEKAEELDERVTVLENGHENVFICLSDIYAVVGDTIQIFFNSIIDGYSEDMILKVVCAYGRAYNNYWECTPTVAATTTFSLSVLDKKGNIIGAKTVNLIVKAATNATKNILCVGDSLMMDGEAPIELSRRLKGTTGVATTPTALNLTNFNVVGRKTNQGDTVGWEGTGGWTWSNYINGTGNPGARFYVTDADNVHIGDIYGISGFTQRFQVVEKNVTSGSGNVLLGFYGRGDIYNDQSLLPSNGTLSLVSGYGQISITFNNSAIESFQPFWNENTDSFDIESYVDEYCGGRVDYLFVLLGINTLIGTNPYNSAAINGIANQAKQFIDLVHAQLPSTIILLGTTLMISQLGGVGTGYFTSSIDGQYNIKAFNHKTIELNKAYMELAQMDDYKDFVKIVDCSAQFDAFYGYPLIEKPYNIRVPERKELISANTVHPMGMIGGQKWEEGIWMVADAIFRAVIGLSA